MRRWKPNKFVTFWSHNLQTRKMVGAWENKPSFRLGLKISTNHQHPLAAYFQPTMSFYLHINVEHEIICFISMPSSLHYLLYTGEESRHVARRWITNQLERTCWSTNDREENRRTFDRWRSRTSDPILGEIFQIDWNRRFHLKTIWSSDAEISVEPNFQQ